MSEATNLPWVLGYGHGLTGPTTPAVCGVTVGECIQYCKWQRTGKEEDYPSGYHIPISHGMDTVAVVPSLPGGNGSENAELLVKAVNHHDALVASLRAVMDRALRDIPLGSWDSTNEPEIYAAWSLLTKLGSNEHL